MSDSPAMGTARIRPMTPEDVLRARLWVEQLRELAPVVGPVSLYEEYAIVVDGVHIGYCSIYNVTGTEAELGIIIGNRDYWGKGYGAEIMNQLTELCFNHLGVKRVHLRVLNSNARAIKCYEKSGFTRCGTLAQDENSFILMEIMRSAHE